MAFKMKGHSLPGINQRMDKSSKPDGRAKSSAFQKPTGWKGKLQAAKDTISEIRDSSTPSQLWSSYKSKKKDIRKENVRDNEAK